MTKQEIQNKAFEAYPKPELMGNSNIPYDFDSNRREGYIKALTEVEDLPKVRGWMAVDKCNGHIWLHQTKPIYNGLYGIWEEPGGHSILASQSSKSFPYLNIDSEPIEVELIIRKI